MAVFLIPAQTYAVGEHQIPEVLIPAGPSRLRFTFDWTLVLDPAIRVAAGLEISLDDGVTWQGAGGFSAAGGAALDRLGNPATERGVVCPLANPAQTNRRLRGNATVTGGPVTAAIRIEVT